MRAIERGTGFAARQFVLEMSEQEVKNILEALQYAWAAPASPSPWTKFTIASLERILERTDWHKDRVFGGERRAEADDRPPAPALGTIQQAAKREEQSHEERLQDLEEIAKSRILSTSEREELDQE